MATELSFFDAINEIFLYVFEGLLKILAMYKKVVDSCSRVIYNGQCLVHFRISEFSAV